MVHSIARVSARALLVAALVLIAATSHGVAVTAAASCVRISGGNFDAPGNDNYAENLNGEYVRIKNYCSSTKSIGG